MLRLFLLAAAMEVSAAACGNQESSSGSGSIGEASKEFICNKREMCKEISAGPALDELTR